MAEDSKPNQWLSVTGQDLDLEFDLGGYLGSSSHLTKAGGLIE